MILHCLFLRPLKTCMYIRHLLFWLWFLSDDPVPLPGCCERLLLSANFGVLFVDRGYRWWVHNWDPVSSSAVLHNIWLGVVPTKTHYKFCIFLMFVCCNNYICINIWYLYSMSCMVRSKVWTLFLPHLSESGSFVVQQTNMLEDLIPGERFRITRLKSGSEAGKRSGDPHSGFERISKKVWQWVFWLSKARLS